MSMAAPDRTGARPSRPRQALRFPPGPPGALDGDDAPLLTARHGDLPLVTVRGRTGGRRRRRARRPGRCRPLTAEALEAGTARTRRGRRWPGSSRASASSWPPAPAGTPPRSGHRAPRSPRARHGAPGRDRPATRLPRSPWSASGTSSWPTSSSGRRSPAPWPPTPPPTSSSATTSPTPAAHRPRGDRRRPRARRAPGVPRGATTAPAPPPSSSPAPSSRIGPGRGRPPLRRLARRARVRPRVRGGRPDRRSTTVFIVDRPGSVQSEIRLGHAGRGAPPPGLLPPPGHEHHPRRRLHQPPEHEPPGAARLHLRRSQRLRLPTRPGPFMVDVAVASDVTARAIEEALEGDRRPAGPTGPPTTELNSARDYLRGVLPLRLQTTAALASRVSGARRLRPPHRLLRGLPRPHRRSHRQGRPPRGQRDHPPDAMTIVIVGDAE
jgi:hypothetical protein